MNNKDREALDKFIDEDSLSSEDTKRFAEMSDGERATFIAERFFEAGSKHGRSQLNELRDDNMSELYDLIKKLQEENKKLVEALKFYADQKSWYGLSNEMDMIELSDCESAESIIHDSGVMLGGKRARQVLKEIGGRMKRSMKTYSIDTDSEYFNESEDYLKYLLCEDQIVVNNGWWDKTWRQDAITIAVNCNDVFAWGCADAEPVLHGDLEELAKAHAKDEVWGIAAWCVKRRKCMPQKPVAEAMAKAGYDLNKLVKGEE